MRTIMRSGSLRIGTHALASCGHRLLSISDSLAELPGVLARFVVDLADIKPWKIVAVVSDKATRFSS